MENSTKMNDLGVAAFLETPNFSPSLLIVSDGWDPQDHFFQCSDLVMTWMISGFPRFRKPIQKLQTMFPES